MLFAKNVTIHKLLSDEMYVLDSKGNEIGYMKKPVCKDGKVNRADITFFDKHTINLITNTENICMSFSAVIDNPTTEYYFDKVQLT